LRLSAHASRCTDGDGWHAGTADGGHARLGVLDADAVVDGEVERGGGRFEDFGVGFAEREVRGIDDGVEAVGDAETLEEGGSVLGGGGEGEADARVAESVEQFGNAGKQVVGRDVLDEALVVLVLLGGEGLFFVHVVRVGSTREDRFEGFHAGYAAQGFVGFAVEGDAEFVGERLPGLVVVLGTVGDDAVEVEGDTAQGGTGGAGECASRGDGETLAAVAECQVVTFEESVAGVVAIGVDFEGSLPPGDAEAEARPSFGEAGLEGGRAVSDAEAAERLRGGKPRTGEGGGVQPSAVLPCTSSRSMRAAWW
jgi:hypothetical protein